jgi:hypothetical protein
MCAAGRFGFPYEAGFMSHRSKMRVGPRLATEVSILRCNKGRKGQGSYLENVMLTALVLVCSLTVTPDLRACDQSSAMDVLRVPEDFASPVTCFMHGQAYVAQTEIGRQLAADERIKVTCTPSGKVADIGPQIARR